MCIYFPPFAQNPMFFETRNPGVSFKRYILTFLRASQVETKKKAGIYAVKAGIYAVRRK